MMNALISALLTAPLLHTRQAFDLLRCQGRENQMDAGRGTTIGHRHRCQRAGHGQGVESKDHDVADCGAYGTF